MIQKRVNVVSVPGFSNLRSESWRCLTQAPEPVAQTAAFAVCGSLLTRVPRLRGASQGRDADHKSGGPPYSLASLCP